MDAPKWSKSCSICKKVKTWDKFIRAADITYDCCLPCFRKMQNGENKKGKTYDPKAALEDIRRLATGLHEDS